MNKQQERDTLAIFTDYSLGLSQAPPQRISRNEQIQGLLALAEQLQGILLPVKPDTRFRRRLHGDLILRAQYQQAEPQPGFLRQHRKGVIIGAALGSLASVVGVVIAFVLRHRHGRATHAATG